MKTKCRRLITHKISHTQTESQVNVKLYFLGNRGAQTCTDYLTVLINTIIAKRQAVTVNTHQT
jgi:hypothetical protein